MNNRRIFLTLPVLLLVLFSFIPQVFAYSSVIITLDSSSDEKKEYPNQCQCVLPNGQLAYSFLYNVGGAGHETVYIITNIYSATGILQGTFNISVNMGTLYGFNQNSFCISNYNSTCLQLWIAYETYTSSYAIYCKVCFLNTVNFGTSSISCTLHTGLTYGGYLRLSNIILLYSSNYYAIISYIPAGSVAGYDSRIFVLKNAGTALTSVIETAFNGHLGSGSFNSGIENLVFSFQDSNNTNNVYFMTAWEDMSTTPKYYSVDLNALVVTELATNPVGSVINSDRHNFFISGGIERDNSTGNILLYWNWTYTWLSGTTPLTNLYQHQLAFNSSGIAPANLIAQNTRVINISPTLPAQTTPIFHVGYSTTKDVVVTIFPFYITSTGVYYEKQLTATIPNWYDYTSTVFTFTTQDINLNGTEPIPYVNVYDLIGRLTGVAYQTNEYSTTVKIYYGMSPFTLNWSVSLTYLPTDNPLYVYTTYQYTLNTYLNGLGYQTTDAIYSDNAYYMTVQTSTSGGYVFSACNSLSAGIHTITIVVIYNSQNVYNKTFSYTYIFPTSTIPTTNQLLPATIIAVTNMMFPLMLISFTSIAFFAITKTTLGLLFGAVIGIIILGIVMPQYSVLIYVVIFLIASVFVLSLRSGGGGGS